MKEFFIKKNASNKINILYASSEFMIGREQLVPITSSSHFRNSQYFYQHSNSSTQSMNSTSFNIWAKILAKIKCKRENMKNERMLIMFKANKRRKCQIQTQTTLFSHFFLHTINRWRKMNR